MRLIRSCLGDRVENAGGWTSEITFPETEQYTRYVYLYKRQEENFREKLYLMPVKNTHSLKSAFSYYSHWCRYSKHQRKYIGSRLFAWLKFFHLDHVKHDGIFFRQRILKTNPMDVCSISLFCTKKKKKLLVSL